MKATDPKQFVRKTILTRDRARIASVLKRYWEWSRKQDVLERARGIFVDGGKRQGLGIDKR